jgi:hypothetical protein
MPYFAPQSPSRVTYFGVADNLATGVSTNLPFVLNNANHNQQPVGRAGVLTQIAAFLSVAVAGSALLVRVSKNNAAPDATLTLSIAIGQTQGVITGIGVAFAAGDTIKLVAITDGAWTAVTSDIQAQCEVTPS